MNIDPKFMTALFASLQLPRYGPDSKSKAEKALKKQRLKKNKAQRKARKA